jgi:hypothetical protein
MQFHHSHYDWWTFPYGCHTSSYGAAYAIYEHEVELLKQDWLIRLYKCARSLKLFGFEEEFRSVREFALPLIEAGGNFRYFRRDCSEIFLEKN